MSRKGLFKGMSRTFKSYDGICLDCGQGINQPYVRCYMCHQRRRRTNWHDAEDLPDLERQDTELGRTEFYVYVLDTTYGHYVGHTGNISARMKDHLSGGTLSTAGGNPRKIWTSRRYYARPDAARLEAQLKSLRDNERPRYQEITGLLPVPFEGPQGQPDAQKVGDLPALWYVLAMLAIGIAIKVGDLPALWYVLAMLAIGIAIVVLISMWGGA